MSTNDPDMTEDNDHIEGIAIVGMAGRFPGAPDVASFWENIKAGRESITHFDISELDVELPTGPEAPPLSDYVCAKGMLEDIDMFDARYFGYLPREAEVMDPQHRLFLEICHEAMEHAGYDPARYDGAVGVYGGCYMDTYLLANLCADDNFRRQLIESIQVGTLQTELGNDKDYLATRVAFKLGLTGPAMTMQTACSTSLVAMVAACQTLDAYGADMMLAGGVTIVLPQKKGYFYKDGSILAPDGHCRTFDENSAGTVFSNGAAVLLLKRLEDALVDRDTIYAVIKGYASNNDGGKKVSYTAPSVEGQSDVILQAMGLAGFEADTLGYVEAHGTATPIGDPIEIGGLTSAYRQTTDEKQYCAIGSVKANLGHLDVASGAIGTIKTVLCLHEKLLTPQINFSQPNPKIGIEDTPFYVNTELAPWIKEDFPRRAGVSSFGVGGTNAHIVLEESPLLSERTFAQNMHLLPLSAKSESALAQAVDNLADFLDTDDQTSLADIAFTLQEGRQQHDWRRFAAGATRRDLVDALRQPSGPVNSTKLTEANPELVFLFPGQGAQYPGMGRGLYESDDTFRQVIDEISDQLLKDENCGTDLRDYILWTENSSLSRDEAAAKLSETWLTQPAIFAVEMALAAMLDQQGFRPAAAIGHSVGEIAAACHAGVFSLADAAALAAARGRLMWDMPRGKMLAILQAADEVRTILPSSIGIAAINAPGATVVSGPAEDIDALAENLAAEDVKATKLATSHGFHSPMMEGAKNPLTDFVQQLPTHPAKFDIYSTADGTIVTPGRLGEAAYWGDQLMKPVLFNAALSEAAGSEKMRIFVEVGPGQALSSFARQGFTGDRKPPVFAALGPSRDPGPDDLAITKLAGQLWMHGISPDWTRFQDAAARRTALPTYPFEHKRFWVDPVESSASGAIKDKSGVPEKSGPGASAASTATPAIDEVEQLIHQQIQLVSQQLKAMQGN